MSDPVVISRREIAGTAKCRTFIQARSSRSVLALIAIVASATPTQAGSPPSPAPQPAVVWIGGEGFWSVWSNWGLNPALDPQFTSVAIDAGNQAYSWVNMDVDASLNSLAIDESDALNILDGRTLTIGGAGAQLRCDGTVRLGSTLLPTALAIRPNGTVRMDGIGNVEMLGDSLAVIAASSGVATLDNQGVTLGGAGRIGANSLTIHNRGLVHASLPYRFLTVDPSSGGFFNQGELRASSNGRLRLTDGSFSNHNGLIHAGAGSRVDLDGVVVAGGILQTSSDGLIRVNAAPVTLANVRLDGRLELGPTKLSLTGQIVNDGLIAAVAGNTMANGDAPTTSYSEILVPPGSGDVKLSGSGVLAMQLALVQSGSVQVGGRLINDAGHTMQGSGLLGNGTAGFVNHGTLIADDELPILVDTKPGDTFINTGVVRATGAGGVMFNNGTFRNDGTIEVHEGSKIFYTVTAVESNAAFSTLSGGVWKVFGSETPASIVMSGPGLIFNNADVTLSGPGSSFQAFNTVQINNGSFTLDQGRNFTTFGTSFSNHGALTIGGGARLNVNGSFTQGAAGVLHVVLGPSAIGVTTPAIVVTGAANLGGTVEIELAPGFVPQSGQTLQLIDAGALNGAFANIVAPAGFQITYTIGHVSMDVGPCRGDLNLDGLISEPDIESLLLQWGRCLTSQASCLADLNGDGHVDQVDVLILLSLFGNCH